MNALSDYLTKSGREESGGLLGAYGERDDAPVLAIAFRHDGRAEAHDFRVLVVAEQERVFDAAMGIAVSLLPQS